MMHILFFVFSNKNKISINFNFKKSNLQTIKIFINRHDNCYLKRDNIYLKRDNLSERTSRGGGGWGAGQGLLELQGCQSVEALRILAAIHRLRTAGMLSEGGSEGGECLAEQVPPCCRMRSAW